MAPNGRPGNVTIEGTTIIFRNLAGEEGPYNSAGTRTFGVLLPSELADQMLADGWNVKLLKPREEGDVPQPWIPVEARYKNRPPRIVMVTHRGNPPKPVRVTLPEDLVEMVDYADIEKVDVILNPYQYSFNGRAGTKAYLQTMFVTVRQDELERKYADVEEIDISGNPLQIGAVAHMGGTPDDIIEGEIVEDEMLQLEG